MARKTRATSPSPVESTSPLPGSEFDNSVMNPPPRVPVPNGRWISIDPTSTWAYSPSQFDPAQGCCVWTAGNPSFSGGQVPAFPACPEIPSPWMMNPGYTDIPTLQPDVSLPSRRSVETTRADTVIHKDMPAENQSEIPHSDRLSDTQE